MSGTVLIVEDDTRIANWVKVYFERAGFSAEVAHDGETGLNLARELEPDLLMLPRLDGVELCRILRRESDVPIIMLTAREAHAERISGLDSGADDYIVKPFDPDEVIARAHAVLRRVKDKVQQVLTCDRLISLTFNDEFEGFDRAIDNQVARLRRQISRGGRQPIQTVYGAGYRLVAEDA